jgi:hypothetical protein
VLFRTQKVLFVLTFAFVFVSFFLVRFLQEIMQDIQALMPDTSEVILVCSAGNHCQLFDDQDAPRANFECNRCARWHRYHDDCFERLAESTALARGELRQSDIFRLGVGCAVLVVGCPDHCCPGTLSPVDWQASLALCTHPSTAGFLQDFFHQQDFTIEEEQHSVSSSFVSSSSQLADTFCSYEFFESTHLSRAFDDEVCACSAAAAAPAEPKIAQSELLKRAIRALRAVSRLNPKRLNNTLCFAWRKVTNWVQSVEKSPPGLERNSPADQEERKYILDLVIQIEQAV